MEDLLRSFVHEDFIKELDFTTLKKLNTKFIPASERSRHADIIYEVKSHGQSAYIYLLLEFQSTVDRFMALRIARYLFELYQEIQRINKGHLLNPAFPILIYNGDERWDAPECFRDLLYPSSIPLDYLPDFRYFKIAVNEISKRKLVKIRNAVSAIFYIENSTSEEIAKSREELVSLLSDVLKENGMEIVRSIVDRIHRRFDIPASTKTIKDIKGLTEVSSMWETRNKRHDESVRREGREEGKLEDAEKMIEKGMRNDDIRDITGLSIKKIEELRNKKR